MTCRACIDRGKTWLGDDPTCYFDDPEHNWNCATVNAIRDICYEGQGLPVGVDYTYCDDEKYATIKIDEVGVEWLGYCLYIQWYKQRGHTDQLWILGNGVPRTPTEEELLAIIDFYKRRKNDN